MIKKRTIIYTILVVVLIPLILFLTGVVKFKWDSLDENPEKIVRDTCNESLEPDSIEYFSSCLNFATLYEEYTGVWIKPFNIKWIKSEKTKKCYDCENRK